MKWEITYDSDIESVVIDALDLSIAFMVSKNKDNIVSISRVPDGLEPFEAGPNSNEKISFKQWWELKGESGKFPLISENIIKWVEERG